MKNNSLFSGMKVNVMVTSLLISFLNSQLWAQNQVASPALQAPKKVVQNAQNPARGSAVQSKTQNSVSQQQNLQIKQKATTTSTSQKLVVKNTTTSLQNQPKGLSADSLQTPSVPATPEESKVKFGLDVSLSYEQAAESDDKGVTARSSSLELVPTVNLSDLKLKGVFSYGYDLNNPTENNDWGDGQIVLSHSGLKTSVVNISPAVGVELPLSKESRENREIQLVTTGSLSFVLNSKELGVENLLAVYSFLYGYYTNKYTSRVNGEPATQYKLSNTFVLGYTWKPISVKTVLQFVDAFSYEDVARTGFFHTQVISYAVNDTLRLGIYHYNKGPIFKAKTYENNLKLYDGNSSNYGLSMDLSF